MPICKHRCHPVVDCIIFLTFIFLPLQVVAEPVDSEKANVAVVEFDGMGNIGVPDAGAIVAEWLVSALGQTGRFELKERVLLRKVLEEQKLSLSGVIDANEALEIGKLYGVKSIVAGGVLRWGDIISVTARLIDAETGSIQRTAVIRSKNLNEIPSLIDSLAQGLVAEQPVITLVAAESVKTTKAQPSGLNTPKSSKVWTEPMTGIEFVWIEGGCYRMGQSEKEKQQIIAEEDMNLYRRYYMDEAPLHEVCVDGFWLSRYETTNAQVHQLNPGHDSKNVGRYSLNGEDQPAVYISWDDAKLYAEWLSENSPSKRSFRLPTEAEWEYAARAGTKTPRFWGTDSDSACKYANVLDRVAKKVHGFAWRQHDCDDGYAVTAPVGSYFPNAFGLYDMLGNVWEWVEDAYDPQAYRQHKKQNPRHQVGETRVRRGGSWADSPGSIRAANRGKRSSDRENNQVGFRLLMVK